MLRGLRALGRGVLRADMTVLDGDTPVGVTTSGTFSPTLKVGIALALIDTDAGIADGQHGGRRRPRQARSNARSSNRRSWRPKPASARVIQSPHD